MIFNFCKCFWLLENDFLKDLCKVIIICVFLDGFFFKIFRVLYWYVYRREVYFFMKKICLILNIKLI